MTIIHQCDQCGAPGRVVETPEGFQCEACYDAAQEDARRGMECPECGHVGVTATGICYACENAPARDPSH